MRFRPEALPAQDYSIWLPANGQADRHALCKLLNQDDEKTQEIAIIATVFYSKKVKEIEICKNIQNDFGVCEENFVLASETLMRKRNGIHSVTIELLETDKRKRHLMSKLDSELGSLPVLLVGKCVCEGSIIRLHCLNQVFLFIGTNVVFGDSADTRQSISLSAGGNEQQVVEWAEIGFNTKINFKLYNFCKLYTRPKIADMVSSVTYGAPIYQDFTESLLTLLETHFKKQERKSSGLLVSGAGGSGKTFLVTETLKKTGMPFGFVNCSTNLVIAGDVAKSEKLLDSIFENDYEVLVLDNIDDLLESDNYYLCNRLIRLFDWKAPKFVIGISRAGRINSSWNQNFLSDNVFGNHLYLGLPNHQERVLLLQHFLKNSSISLTDESFWHELSHNCNGFTPLDVMGLVQKAILFSCADSVSKESLISVARSTDPSNLNGILSKIPDTSFASFYGINDKIAYLNEQVVLPFLQMDHMGKRGISLPKGLLIYGPSGVGKTALAIATANATGLSCIYVNSTAIRSKVVGESERAIANLFTKARNSSPCILLMDQFEMIVPHRKSGISSTSQGSGERIVTSFLIEMDGILQKNNSKDCVFLIAVANDRTAIDPAILRPGRIDIHLEMELPDQSKRLSFLKASLSKLPQKDILEDAHFLLNLSASTKGFSNADLVMIIQKASMIAVRNSSLTLEKHHVVEAFKNLEK